MTRQQRSEVTHSKILKAAEACFARYGYNGTGVAEICRRAGVGKGGFYHHFPSKQALFLELLNRWLSGLDEQMAARRAGARSIPQSLIAMAETMPEVFEAAEGQLPLFLEFLMQAMRDPAVWKSASEPYRRYRRFFAEMIDAGMAEGSLRRVDAEMAARVIVSLAVGVLLQDLLDKKGRGRGQAAQAGIRLLLEGLERKK